MRTGIIVEVSATDRERLAAIVADRNAPQKHVWRAHIVLLTAMAAARRRSCGARAPARRQSGVGRSGS